MVRVAAERTCLGFCASSPQPALARVAARGQPEGHLASGGGGAEWSDEAAEAVVEAGLKKRGDALEEAEEAERKLGGQFWRMEGKTA